MSDRTISAEAEARFFSGVQTSSDFFRGKANVQKALEKLTRILEDAGVPYAIVGAMALNEHGYERVTDDVDVLLTQNGLETFKRQWLGRGYVERFPGSRGLRDTENNVSIDVVVAGDYPGDGKPKSVRFPDPAAVGLRGERVRLVPLETLIELKLASGLSAPHRLRDLADVLELIRIRNLPPDFDARLDASVRPKYRELWDAAQTRPDDE